MSELRQGILQVRTVKRGKQVVIEVPTRKGSHLLPVNEKALSADLAALPESQLNGLAVSYELETTGRCVCGARGSHGNRRRPPQCGQHEGKKGNMRSRKAHPLTSTNGMADNNAHNRQTSVKSCQQMGRPLSTTLTTSFLPCHGYRRTPNSLTSDRSVITGTFPIVGLAVSPCGSPPRHRYSSLTLPESSPIVMTTRFIHCE